MKTLKQILNEDAVSAHKNYVFANYQESNVKPVTRSYLNSTPKYVHPEHGAPLIASRIEEPDGSRSIVTTHVAKSGEYVHTKHPIE